MHVKVTSPVEGKEPGETVEVNKERGEFLLANGYAIKGDEPKAKQPVEKGDGPKVKQPVDKEDKSK